MIDAWSGPTPTPQQFPANQPNGILKLLEKIKGIETELRDVRSHLPGATGISNTMLASPVRTDAIYSSATNFALSTTNATKASLTVTVPDGFTTAAVSAIGRVYAINPNTGADYLYAQAQIGAYNGLGLPMYVPGAGYSAMNVAPFSKVLTGLTSGGTFSILVNAATANLAWAANTLNLAELSGTIGWYR